MICCPWRPHQPKERKTKMKRGTKRKENWRKVKVVKVRQLHSSLPPPLPCPSLSLPFSHSPVILSPLPSFPFTSFSFPSISFPTLVSVPPFLPHLSLSPTVYHLPVSTRETLLHDHGTYRGATSAGRTGKDVWQAHGGPAVWGGRGRRASHSSPRWTSDWASTECKRWETKTYWSSNVFTLIEKRIWTIYIHEHTFLFSRHYVCRYTGCSMWKPNVISNFQCYIYM